MIMCMKFKFNYAFHILSGNLTSRQKIEDSLQFFLFSWNRSLEYTVIPTSENSCFTRVVQFSSCLRWQGNSVPVTPSWIEMAMYGPPLKKAGEKIKKERKQANKQIGQLP